VSSFSSLHPKARKTRPYPSHHPRVMIKASPPRISLAFRLPLFDLSTITVATGNFSEINRIGEGDFGLVYWVIQCFFVNLNIRRVLQNYKYH